MKAYVNRFPVFGPWGGGNLWTSAFHKHAPESGIEVINQGNMTVAPDVILLAGLDNDGKGISADQAIMYKMMMSNKKDVKIVIRVNENDARKATNHVDEALLKLSKHVDGTIFVSNWLKTYFEDKGWSKDNSTVIINGVDREIFKSQPKLNNGKLNIVAHHWSHNVMKGFDIYEKLDEFVGQNSDKFTFTYIGRDRMTFKHTNVVKPLFGEKLGAELGKYDLYVSASRFDPGPNHILEALACGLITLVHVDGGGCCEFAGHSAMYRTWEQLQAVLEEGTAPAQHPVALNDWQTCIKQYLEFLETTCKKT
jgi:glycosyltransferase involved in cell wall biosynthesis